MKKSWEQELKTKIEILLQLPNAEGALMPMLTDFISSLFLQARKEAREETLREVIEMVYGMKPKYVVAESEEIQDIDAINYTNGYVSAYNQSLDDLLTKLNEL